REPAPTAFGVLRREYLEGGRIADDRHRANGAVVARRDPLASCDQLRDQLALVFDARLVPSLPRSAELDPVPLALKRDLQRVADPTLRGLPDDGADSWPAHGPSVPPGATGIGRRAGVP